MLGIIGGTSLLFADLPPLEKMTIATPFGKAEVHRGAFVLLLRHQYNLPPHRINYRACLAALAILGADRIVAFGSAGSLKPEITPGSIVIPTDYLSVTDIPSVHECTIEHVRPELDADLIRILGELVPEARVGGVYAQTRGPRIETVAEVRALARVADVVGMTVASEATLARELGMRFAAICTVDNYANGLGEETLTYEHILETSRANRRRTEKILTKIVERLA
ncbi:MAG TPA: MTAP family purine nucleoside phosphorylase [Candidatus Methanoculleus thermohydrogenotrophicum]|nr:MTAP family purine nucleoside phosphorylase [Candidatus Methanoculleus thermohydrogenotrophicum]NLM82745.1 MTAP family purine nucleoside phosphorylase [Candidatus Methanoculleus thermohydrogenotrophicum]HOB19035.1 MTAP family purine nucleoside phosphorylase [Candidatus Methanoculleus thermohydrogenotrophicum]HPZ39063.1 MTAP family purine nucleoside phosphorylase [Candidatus Methanoculleus thermohydrogenotrophicum]HQC92182.1 MTAP family purine nucleoside phosphorylase [Candidatus Methanoculle